MIFPIIENIATTSVVSIDVDNTISSAIKKMFEHEHRNIVVIDGDIFRILRVSDILNIKAKKIDLNSSLKNLELLEIPTLNRDKNVLHTLEYLSCEVEYICVINDDGSLYGLLSHADIISSIDPDTLMDNFRLLDFLKLSRRTKWIGKDVKTSDLLCEMAQNSFESAIVIENFMPIGIFTTKDVLKVIEKNEDSDLPVSSYMSAPVETINKNTSVKNALDFLKQKHYKRVVVVDDDGKMSGVISQKELISTTYSRWAVLTKEYQKELCEINTALINKNIKYKDIASRDSLTKLYNRYKFSEFYQFSYETMIERESEMSLIMIDIDNFKKVNDIYGHNAGDSVIVKISQTLVNNLRNIDIVCRWGGEEFVILLPAVDIDNAALLAEKLRSYIEDLEFDNIGAITASFGISRVVQGDDLKSVVNRADEALYLAKKSGRNCVKLQIR